MGLLKNEISGEFEKVILGLMQTPAEYDATCVRNAVKGAGTDEAALIDIITSRSNQELQAIKAAYKKCKLLQMKY